MGTRGQVYRRPGRADSSSAIPTWVRHIAFADVDAPPRANGGRPGWVRVVRDWINPDDVYVPDDPEEIERARREIDAILARIERGDVDPEDGLGKGRVYQATYWGVLDAAHVVALHRRGWRVYALDGTTVHKTVALVPPNDPDAPAE